MFSWSVHLMTSVKCKRIIQIYMQSAGVYLMMSHNERLEGKSKTQHSLFDSLKQRSRKISTEF